MTVSRTKKALRSRILYAHDRSEKMRRSELKGRRLLVLLMLIVIVILLCLSLVGCTKNSIGYVQSDSAIPDLSPLARQPEIINMLADLYEASERDYNAAAAEADNYYKAGLTCEIQYDSLKAKYDKAKSSQAAN